MKSFFQPPPPPPISVNVENSNRRRSVAATTPASAVSANSSYVLDRDFKFPLPPSTPPAFKGTFPSDQNQPSADGSEPVPDERRKRADSGRLSQLPSRPPTPPSQTPSRSSSRSRKLMTGKGLPPTPRPASASSYHSTRSRMTRSEETGSLPPGFESVPIPVPSRSSTPYLDSATLPPQTPAPEGRKGRFSRSPPRNSRNSRSPVKGLRLHKRTATAPEFIMVTPQASALNTTPLTVLSSSSSSKLLQPPQRTPKAPPSGIPHGVGTDDEPDTAHSTNFAFASPELRAKYVSDPVLVRQQSLAIANGGGTENGSGLGLVWANIAGEKREFT